MSRDVISRFTSRLFIPEGVGTLRQCFAIQCTPTFHHLFYKFHVIGGEPMAIKFRRRYFRTDTTFKPSRANSFLKCRQRICDSFGIAGVHGRR
uniref:SFRICE_022325 n=1 Tax=Spodoptera frugiperda TaxID=7108 RepID=A0A2H1WR25_SPOFR